MKRLLTILLCTLLLALPLLPAAQAAVAYFDYEVTETLEDGSRLVTSIQMEEQLETDTFDLLSLLRMFLQRLLRRKTVYPGNRMCRNRRRTSLSP